jgi:hypothetical protein
MFFRPPLSGQSFIFLPRSFIVHAIDFIHDVSRFCSITVAMTDFRKANDSFLIQNESGILVQSGQPLIYEDDYYFSGLFYETVNCLVGVILKCNIFQISKKSALVNHVP